MPINVLDLTDIVEKDVFTDKGAYCGKTQDIDLNITKFQVRAIVVEAASGSYLAKKVGGKKGVIIPYSMVSSIQDVIMIKHFKGETTEAESEEKKSKEEYYDKEEVEEE